MSKRLLGLILAAVAIGVFASPALAAAPDGAGPWADTVVSSDQGLRNDGTPVLPARSDPTAALGVAERPVDPTTAGPGTFFALGFGGEIELGFDNRICNVPGDDLDLELVEATKEPYEPELVDVFVSKDGSSYTLAASDVNKDATIGLPDGTDFVNFVKVVDKTDPAISKDDADGYDLDGVQALADSSVCKDPDPDPDPRGKIYGGGLTKYNAHLEKVCKTYKVKVKVKVKTKHGWDYEWKYQYETKCEYKWRYDFLTHAVKIYCDDAGKDFLAAYSNKGVFILKNVTERSCTDDPAIAPDPPAASFDTVTGKGTGYWNGKPATVEFVFTDAGEPGNHDRVRIKVTDSYGKVVLDVDQKIDCGNHQAVNLPPL